MLSVGTNDAAGSAARINEQAAVAAKASTERQRRQEAALMVEGGWQEGSCAMMQPLAMMMRDTRV